MASGAQTCSRPTSGENQRPNGVAACFRKNLASFSIARLVSGERACCSLDLIEVGLQICPGALNQRQGANWCATFFGELDQVVQVNAEFARGFDRTGVHVALPRDPSSSSRPGGSPSTPITLP